MTAIRDWLVAHDWIFSNLQTAQLEFAQAPGRAGRSHQASSTSPDTHAALSEVGDTRAAFADVIERAQLVPSTPDVATQRHFTAALSTLAFAARDMSPAAARRDLPAILRTADRLEAGNDQTLLTAAALPRATGQPPDPSNPLSR